MVDFGAMGDKAKDFVGDHADQAKQGVDKVGDAVGDKIGQDKVDGVQQKANEAIDNLNNQGDQQQPQQ
ncbi:antitoxin [Nakamurella sp. DB0629]|uniref:Antitoxin n=2 Tax=Nakamurella aerolata TaxID=1656892 RepID=A0A849AGN3_9ACTN|nr:antitoxin [Nakamurella aerolata]